MKILRHHATFVIVYENFRVIGPFGKIKLLAGLSMVYNSPSFGDYFIVSRVAPWMRLNSWLRLSLGDLKVRELFVANLGFVSVRSVLCVLVPSVDRCFAL